VGRVARRASAPAANAYRPQAAALMHPPVSVGFVATHMATCYPKCRLLAIISSEMQCCIGGSTMVESASRLWADVAAASSSVWAKTMRQQACGAAGHTRKDCFSYAGLRHGLGGFVVRAGTAGLRQSLCNLHPEVVLWWYKLGIPINY